MSLRTTVISLVFGLLVLGGAARADSFAGRALQWNTIQHQDNKLPVLDDVLFGQGKYVASGEGTIMESTHGQAWSTVFSDRNFVFGPTIYGDGRYVANGSGVLAVSKDGLSWHEVVLPSQDAFFFLAFGAGRYVATGIQCTPSACASHVFTSTDLIDWTVQDLGAITQNDFGPVAYNGREFMVLTDNRNSDGKWALTSPDGLEWNASDFVAPDHASLLKLRVVRDQFMALGGWNNPSCVEPLLNNVCVSPYLAFTEDGKHWSSVKLTQPFNLFNDVTYVGGQYLAVMVWQSNCGVCLVSFKLMASTDGQHWGLAQGVPADAKPISIATDGTSAVAVGVDGSIVSAPNAGGTSTGAFGLVLLAALLGLLGWRSLSRQA